MVMLNLLPWRERAARHQKRSMQVMLLSASAASLFFLLCVDRYLSGQQTAVSEQIVQLKKEYEWRVGLFKANQESQQAETSHASIVDLLRRLNESSEVDVCFEQIKKTKQGIEFMGLSETAEELTRFLQAAPVAAYFSELKIMQLQQMQGQRIKFRLLGKLNAV